MAVPYFPPRFTRQGGWILVLLFVVMDLAVMGWSQSPEVPANQRNNLRRGYDVSKALTEACFSLGDKDQDQRLTLSETRAVLDQWFSQLDRGEEGRLSQEVFLRRWGGLMPQVPVVAERNEWGGEPVIGDRSAAGDRPTGNREVPASDPSGLSPGPRFTVPERERGSLYGTTGRFVGLFVSLDRDHDQFVTRQEWDDVWGEWLHRWNAAAPQGWDRDDFIQQIKQELPKTNMGNGALVASDQRLPGLPDPPPSPVLSPEASRDQMLVDDAFRVEIAAAEPLIEDPISITWDDFGFLYVLEMRSFMMDLDRTGENDPISRISRLQDTDGDGRYDRSTIFVDGLILPRALAAFQGGLLYVSNYQLYFAKDIDRDGRADITTLVDPDYGMGNLEHAANGLMPALDNWIYNARSPYRYRWFQGRLVRQPTENRGQWGITQDDDGRLFYNVNNSQLLGDITPPNYISRNPNYPTTAGINLFVATDQRVFSARMNTAVNRGNLPDVIDPETGKLFVFASSCSPAVYRGDTYGPDFLGNAFVCDPSANLIKRNLVSMGELTMTSVFAYSDREFLASADERFRPVQIVNGPDGVLWVVDMYRGINQYGLFMTDYLRRETQERQLDDGIHLGRIYRIVKKESSTRPTPQLGGLSSRELVQHLADPRGWVRDASQRILVERRDQSVVPDLLKQLEQGSSITQIHTLWTLEGLFLELPEGMTPSDATLPSSNEAAPERVSPCMEVAADLRFEALSLTDEVLNVVLDKLHADDPRVQSAAIRVAESLISWSPADAIALQQELTNLLPQAGPALAFQLTLTAGNLPKPESLPLLVSIASRFAEIDLIREGLLSGVGKWEIPLLKLVLADTNFQQASPERELFLESLAASVMRERHPANVDELLRIAAEQQGEQRWRQVRLIEGMASVRPHRQAPRIKLRAEPMGFATLQNNSDPQFHSQFFAQLEAIRDQLSWPGFNYELTSSVKDVRQLTPDEQRLFDEGKLTFRQICAGCHGLTGLGIRPLAAPLVDSDWVLGSDERLIRIVLQGLTGPVHVDGVTYQPPIVLPTMPAVGALSDRQIAGVLSYIRREWEHTADPVPEERVQEIRSATRGRQVPWTEQELLEPQTSSP